LFPEINDSWSSLWYPTRKGETVDEVHDRTAGFLEVFIPEVERRMPTTHSRILLVSHAATVIALTRELVGDRNLPLRIGCCTLTDLRRKTDAKVLGGWTAKTLASGDHLRGGIQRDWGFEDIFISDGKVGFLVHQPLTCDLLYSSLSMILVFLEPMMMKVQWDLNCNMP
jgi:transcription factor C subunit 7